MEEKEPWEIKKLRAETRFQYFYMIVLTVAGIWAYFTFSSLREVYLADAKVAEYESKNISLELSTDINELGIQENGKIAVEIIVNIQNKGILPIDVDLNSGEVFTLSHILNGFYSLKTADEEKVQYLNKLPVGNVYSSKAYNRLTEIVIRNKTSTSIRPNSTNRVSYLIYVDEPGLYLASFISEIPQDIIDLMERREIGDLKENVTHSSAWMSQRYFYITGQRNQKSSDSDI